MNLLRIFSFIQWLHNVEMFGFWIILELVLSKFNKIFEFPLEGSQMQFVLQIFAPLFHIWSSCSRLRNIYDRFITILVLESSISVLWCLVGWGDKCDNRCRTREEEEGLSALAMGDDWSAFYYERAPPPPPPPRPLTARNLSGLKLMGVGRFIRFVDQGGGAPEAALYWFSPSAFCCNHMIY
jgi:hypothetical protein